MSTDATGVTLTHSDNTFDMFIATMAEMPEVGANAIEGYIPLFDYLTRKNLIKMKGSIGPYIPVVIMDKENPTIRWISGYDDANSTPADVLSEGKAQYGHLTGRIVTNREEQVKNASPQQLIDLVEKKHDQLKIGLRKELNAGIMSSDEADGRKITGLGRIMDPTATLHGLAPAKYDYWKPTQAFKTGTTKFSLATERGAGLRKLFRKQTTVAAGTAPDVVLMGEDLWDAHMNFVESKMQVSVGEVDKVSPSMMGDVMIEVNGRTFIYSEEIGAKEAWSLNFRDALELRAHKGTWFHQTPWKDITSKVQTIAQDNLTYLSLFCKNRRALGKIEFQ
ncbi:MAG: phage major capsid protein [Candidatus Sedimenticola sp. (ex Thyasira tokunagai)]